MKIIDKTPFRNDKDEIELLGRIQGTLRYGLNWYSELQAQSKVIEQFDRIFEKGFALIRNFNLPGSQIIIPLILLGPHGLSLIYVTHLRGFYEAKGDQWNRLDNGRSIPARIDLIQLTLRLTRALQKYFELQKINVPVTVESVLIAADPGLHLETMRPAIRVVMSDAIKSFAGSLMQGRPVLRSEQVYDLADRIANPREAEAPAPQSASAPASAAAASPQPPASRAKAIFDAAEKTPPVNPADLGFAFDEDATHIAPQGLPPGVSETSPIRKLPSQQAPKKTARRLSVLQIGFLAGILLVECCVLAAGAYFFLFNR